MCNHKGALMWGREAEEEIGCDSLFYGLWQTSPRTWATFQKYSCLISTCT